jgi:hypothetical protein
VPHAIEAQSEDKMARRAPEMTKTRLLQVLDDSFGKREFQNFVSIVVHARTCNECKVFFDQAMQRSRFHLESQLQ